MDGSSRTVTGVKVNRILTIMDGGKPTQIMQTIKDMDTVKEITTTIMAGDG